MKCPVCQSVMVILEHDAIEIDHCVECGGVWLDAGELELIVNDPIKVEQLLANFVLHAHPAVDPRKCPICRAKMHEVQVAAAQGRLVLDQCPNRHGIWFDKDELQATIMASDAAMDENVTKILTAIFGSKE